MSELPDSIIELHRKICREQTQRALEGEVPEVSMSNSMDCGMRHCDQITPATIETVLNRLQKIPEQ